MFGASASPATKGFGNYKYSSNTRGFGFGSVPCFGEQKTGAVFGGTGDAKKGKQFENGNLTAGANVFGKSPTLVFGNGGSSASSLPGHGASNFSFGRNVDVTWHPAIGSSPSPLFGGSSASRSDAGGFPSVFGQTTNTSGSNSLYPERNSLLRSEPAVASRFTAFTFGSKLTPLCSTKTSNVPALGVTAKAAEPAVLSVFTEGAFTFGSKLTPLGSTNTSNVPAFGVTAKAAAEPAVPSGFTEGAFTFGSKLTPLGSTNTSNVPAFGIKSKAAEPAVLSGFTGGPFTFGSNLKPLSSTNTLHAPAFGITAKAGGGGSNTEPYQPTPLVDNTGKKTAENLQSKSAMHTYQNKSHEELRWDDYQCSRGNSWADSAVQPNEKISSNTCLPCPIRSNFSHTVQHLSPVSVEKPAFTGPSVCKEKGFGIFTAPWLAFTSQLPAAQTEVTLKPAWWAVPQPAIVSIPTTPVPVPLSSNGQSLPSSPWFLEHSKPAQEPKVSLGENPLQTSNGITFPTTPQDAATPVPAATIASTLSIPVSNQISPISSVGVGDVQPSFIANVFGTHGEMRSHLHSKPSMLVQQGISGMPMVSKPTTVKTSSLLTCRSRHLSRSRVKIPTRKPTPTRNDADLRVPFFYAHDEFPHAAKGHCWVIARESPKAWVSNPTLVSSPVYNLETTSPVNSDGASEISPGNFYGDKTVIAGMGMLKIANEEEHVEKENYPNNSIISQISEEVEPSQLPKLQLSDYYTEPSMEELAAKEKTDPGFLSRVKDFVVGRHGYGHIKFPGETDVRQLDITSILKFSYREILVYPDDTTKPPIGQGLNKPAEITLLNIKAINKNSGRQYTTGEMADKFKMMLLQKAKENEAEFISYDPVTGEWKFSVPHLGCN